MPNTNIALTTQPLAWPTTTAANSSLHEAIKAAHHPHDCGLASATIAGNTAFNDAPENDLGGDDDDGDDDDDEEESGLQNKAYTISDYFDVRVDSSTGKLRNTFTCPRADTQCDGFVFDSIEECQAHERDWHAGPYRCFVCGHLFASGPRLRRHAHYTESETRKVEVEAAEARRGGYAAVKVYHGNDPARSRARRLAKMVRAEEAERENAERKVRKTTERKMMAARQAKKRKGVDDEPLVVIGAEDGDDDIAMGGTEEEGVESCREPCCPYFEKSFVSSAVHARHLATQAHVAAVRMGEALIEQVTTTLLARTSITVRTNNPEDARNADRASTPPPRRPPATHLPSPPPTPHTIANEEDDFDGVWDGKHVEELPMAIERRLNKTRRTLRELRCNAPGCELYGKQMATSHGYWSHLASGAHTKALRAWCERGGDAVYVRA